MENKESTVAVIPPVPDEPKAPPTLKEIKQARRMFFTVHHPRVKACNHTFVEGRQPKNNCEYCWFAFFQQYGEMTSEVDKLFREKGRNAVIQVRGEKFTKMFVRFMATVAKFVAEQQAQQQNQVAQGVNGEERNDSGNEEGREGTNVIPETTKE